MGKFKLKKDLIIELENLQNNYKYLKISNEKYKNELSSAKDINNHLKRLVNKLNHDIQLQDQKFSDLKVLNQSIKTKQKNLIFKFGLITIIEFIIIIILSLNL